MTRPKKRGGCLKIGCGGLLGLFVLSAIIGAIGGERTASTDRTAAAPISTSPVDTAPASSPEPPRGVDHGELLVECERAVRARLNFPDEAKFTSAFMVGLNEEISDSGESSVWQSSVKAKNAFGVQSTISFACSKSVGDPAVTLIMRE